MERHVIIDAKLEAVRIFLTFAAFEDFKVFQMDMKFIFVNAKLLEEVYVKRPPGFKSSMFPDHVYKRDKALCTMK